MLQDRTINMLAYMQVCRVNFQLEMFSQDNVILMPDNIKLLIDMTNQYVIAKGTLDFQDHGTDILTQSSLLLPFILLDLPSKGLKMEIVFKRLLTNDLLTTYLPSFLLLLMSYATTFFKPFYFEAAVTVNLSILLVITTLFVR